MTDAGLWAWACEAVVVLRFARSSAVEYVLTFIAFWVAGIAAIVTGSNRVDCDPSGCPTTPAYPVLFVVGVALAAGLFVQGWRQARRERDRVLSDATTTNQVWDSPAVRQLFRWWLISAFMLFGLALPSAVRALRHG